MSVKTLDLDQPKPQAKSASISRTKSPGRFKAWLLDHRWLVLGISLILVALILTLAWLFWPKSSPIPSPISNHQPTVTPTPEIPNIPNPLNGVLYTKDQAATFANRRPLAVMVENHVDARPQSGLNDAEVIYEAMAEGGITRFMALYLHNQVAKVGPVRSARLHFISWAAEYDAAYAHWGGSAPALAYLRNNSRPRDIDQFYNAGAFYRDYSGGRSLEHTGYSSTEALWKVVSLKGWMDMPTFRSWTFKEDLAQAQRPAEQTVNLDFLNSANYKATFTYRPLTNDYVRLTAGQPHLDDQGQQLTAKTIILQLQKVTSYTDDGGHAAVDVTTTGSGPAIIIQDGLASEGQWSKSTYSVRTTFTDAEGKDILLNRGKIWVVSVPQGSNYSY